MSRRKVVSRADWHGLELSLSQSLESKGLLRGTNSRYVSGESVTTMEGEEPEMTMVNVGGREQAITLTFGILTRNPQLLRDSSHTIKWSTKLILNDK